MSKLLNILVSILIAFFSSQFSYAQREGGLSKDAIKANSTPTPKGSFANCDSDPAACAEMENTGKVSKPGESSSDKSSSVTACASASKKAAMACTGLTMFVSMAPMMLSQVQAAQSNGDISKPCDIMKDSAYVQLMGSVGTIYACNKAQHACEAACRGSTAYEDRTKLATCESYSMNKVMVALQAAQTIPALSQAGACKDQTKDNCNDPVSSVNNPKCPAYCTVPGHEFTAECRSIYSSTCSNPTEAATNPTCICMKNPNDPICRTLVNGQTPMVTTPINSDMPGFDNMPSYDNGLGGLARDIEDEETKRAAAAAGSATEIPGGGAFAPGGGGGGGGSSGGFGSNGGGQGSGASKDPEIFLKLSGGGGEGGYGSAGTVDEGAGEQVAGGKSGKKNGPLDLSQFLPGAAKDPRAIASIQANELLKNGISPAHGLSNFEKITRKLNQKRETLLP